MTAETFVEGLGEATGTITGVLDFNPVDPRDRPLHERLQKLIPELSFTLGGQEWQFDLSTFSTSVFVGCVEGVVNSYRPDAKLPRFGTTVYFDPKDTDEDVIEKLRVEVLALVDHEVHEFFKRNGRPVIDPHRDMERTRFAYSRRAPEIKAREAALREPERPKKGYLRPGAFTEYSGTFTTSFDEAFRFDGDSLKVALLKDEKPKPLDKKAQKELDRLVEQLSRPMALNTEGI